ncbi:hypothetical protein GGS24DRAFT_515728 [Hypoxylon argillaceum]|nr:hypothetical protein GGS24DRAFT_515728 [Hypoxylon argillaceum]
MATQPPKTLESSHDPSCTEDQPRKRRAEDSLSPSSTKRRRVSNSSSVPLWRQPHPLSVNGLLRKHCRTRLFVHPLRWTAQHLELLGYQFFRRSKSELRDHSQHPHQNSLQLPSEAETRQTIERLRSRSNVKTWIMCQFLTGCNATYAIPPDDRSRLLFDFKRKTIARLPTNGVYSHHSNMASFAYLDLNSVVSVRDKAIRVTVSRILDGPVRRIKQVQRRRLQPSIEAEDPYIVAVLIALAQGLQRQHREQSVDGPDECLESAPTKLDPAALPQQTPADFEVRLLALAKDSRHLYFYKAKIPSTSLDMFNEPSQYHSSSVVEVTYHSVRLEVSETSVQNIESIIRSL